MTRTRCSARAAVLWLVLTSCFSPLDLRLPTEPSDQTAVFSSRDQIHIFELANGLDGWVAFDEPAPDSALALFPFPPADLGLVVGPYAAPPAPSWPLDLTLARTVLSLDRDRWVEASELPARLKELQTTRSPSCRPFELETRRLDGSESFLVEGGPEHAWLGVRGDGLYRVTRDGLDRVDLEILPEAAARLGDDLYVATLDASGLGLVKIGPALELTPLISTSTYTLPLLELAAAFGRDGNPRIVAIAGFEIASAPTLFLEAQLGTAPKWASLGRVPHERGVGARAMFTDEGELLAVTGKEFVVSFRPPEKPTLETLPLRSDRFEHFRATTLDIGPAVVTHLIVPGPDLSLFYERDSERRWAAVRALPSGQDDRYQLTGVARLEGRTFVSARNGELREVEGEDTLCPGQSVHPIRHMVALRDAIVVAGNQGPEVWTSFVVPRP